VEGIGVGLGLGLSVLFSVGFSTKLHGGLSVVVLCTS